MLVKLSQSCLNIVFESSPSRENNHLKVVSTSDCVEEDKKSGLSSTGITYCLPLVWVRS